MNNKNSQINAKAIILEHNPIIFLHRLNNIPKSFIISNTVLLSKTPHTLFIHISFGNINESLFTDTVIV